MINIAVICRQGIYDRIATPLTDKATDVTISPPLFQWNEALKYMQEKKVDGIIVEAGVQFYEQIKSFPLPLLVYSGQNQGFGKVSKDWLQSLRTEMASNTDHTDVVKNGGDVPKPVVDVSKTTTQSVSVGLKIAVVASDQKMINLIENFAGLTVVARINNFQEALTDQKNLNGAETLFLEESILSSYQSTIRELKIQQLVEEYKNSKVRVAMLLFERNNPSFMQGLVKKGFYDFLCGNEIKSIDIERIIKVPRAREEVAEYFEEVKVAPVTNAQSEIDSAENPMKTEDVNSPGVIPVEVPSLQVENDYKVKVDKAYEALLKAEKTELLPDIASAELLIDELRNEEKSKYGTRLLMLKSETEYKALSKRAEGLVAEAEHKRTKEVLMEAQDTVFSLTPSHQMDFLKRLEMIEHELVHQTRILDAEAAVVRAEETKSYDDIKAAELALVNLLQADKIQYLSRLDLIKQQQIEEETVKELSATAETNDNRKIVVNSSLTEGVSQEEEACDTLDIDNPINSETNNSKFSKVASQLKRVNSFFTNFVGGMKNETEIPLQDQLVAVGEKVDDLNGSPDDKTEPHFTFSVPHRVIVYSPKGGAGATTVSTELAENAMNNSVGLAEIAYSYGQLAGLLDLKPKYSIADVEEGMEEYAVLNQKYLCAPWVFPVKKSFNEEMLREWLGRSQRAFPGKTVLADLQSQSSPLILMGSHEWATRVIWVVQDTDEHLGMADLQMANLKKMGGEWQKIGLLVQEVSGKKIDWTGVLEVPVIGFLTKDRLSKKWKHTLHTSVNQHLGFISK
ncbi:hypothetical protein [Paenibacillus sp. Leaf72]|uniref:hypothetical protein n=1 Tax=Paenibacillus sp. Leaf72 TaxID=1736234 RepID=UPI0007003ACB|nr:hypothetical protein [Paenibacillus sp. Leaf72]KQN97031.1 hypothetical protein ASF12_23465 [Paenibacillus sp. Leaf72]